MFWPRPLVVLPQLLVLADFLATIGAQSGPYDHDALILS
jgi:hypothetical protein